MIARHQTNPNHLQHVVEISHEAVVTIDAAQKIVAFNRRAEKMFGYERKEILGAPLETLLPKSVTRHHGKLVRDFLNLSPQDRLMAPHRPVRACDASGQEFEVLITVYSTGNGSNRVATAVIVAPNQYEDSKEQLRSLLDQNRRNGRQLIKRENEYRMRLAQMIHNDLAQEAVSIAVNLELVREMLPNSSRDLETLFARIEASTQRLHDTVDHLINRTRPPSLDTLTLPAAINECIKRLGIIDSGLNVEINIPHLFSEIEEPAKTISYRILQESLTNIMRHARPAASQIRIELHKERKTQGANEIHISVDDDGPGPTPYRHQENSGAGLEQIREWCLALGGKLETGRSTLGGFHLHALFSIEDSYS